MRTLSIFLMALVGGILLLALSTQSSASEGAGPGAGGDESDNGTAGPRLALFDHARKVTSDELDSLTFRFSVKELKGEDPANLTFKLAWARATYGEEAANAAKDINSSATGLNQGDGGRGGSANSSSNDVSDELDQIEKKYALKWNPLSRPVQQIGNSTNFAFQLAGQHQLPAGYYLLRVQVLDEEGNRTLMWLFSDRPLMVYYKEVKQKVSLNIITVPDYPNSTLHYRVRYEGPFLENPLAFITAPHIGLVDHRINMSGIMVANGGELTGNYSFFPLPIPHGAYTLHLRGVDGANRTVSVNSHFILKAHNLTSDGDNEVESESGRLKIKLKVKGNLTNALLSLEELDINPGHELNLTKLKLKFKDQIPPGQVHKLGRYLSVEPSSEVIQQLRNATLRFYVNATDLDENGTPLGQRIHGLRVFYFNETSGEWEPVAGSGYDPVNGYVWALIPHFSIYGLFGTNVAPTASIDPASVTVYSGEEFTLQGEGNDLDGEIVEWAWDLDGDGEYELVSTTSGEVTHSYTTTGTHQAKLRVSDDQGATGFEQITITVKDGSADDDDDSVPLPIWVSLMALLAAVVLIAGRRR